ncbi:MAG: biotin transporter BioY [Clostridiales bacterium]|nr:biotin transporter BioY [Clostridiales bacterium]
MDANHKARLFEIREMAQAGVLTAAMIALSQLSIPLPLTPVPLTMSVFAVFLIASALPLRRAVMAQATYLLLGAIGLPVFAGFRGGIAVLFGPTGGYLIAYVPMTAAISLLISAIENIKWLSAKPVSKHAATAAGAAAAAPEPNPTAAAAPSRISNLAHAAAPPRSSA